MEAGRTLSWIDEVTANATRTSACFYLQLAVHLNPLMEHRSHDERGGNNKKKTTTTTMTARWLCSNPFC